MNPIYFSKSCSTYEAAHYDIVQKQEKQLKNIRTKSSRIKKSCPKKQHQKNSEKIKIMRKLKQFPY